MKFTAAMLIGATQAIQFKNIGVRFYPEEYLQTADSDAPNTRNLGVRSMSQKWMGTKSAADPISPENMDEWVYEYTKDNTSSQTQWHAQKSRPAGDSNVQLGHDQWQPADLAYSDGPAEKVHVVEPANYQWYQNTNTLWGTPIMRSTFF